MKNRKGQSIIEALFLILSLGMVLTGAIVLLINSVNSRTKGIDRKKATELSDTIMEGLVNSSLNDSGTFWQLTTVPKTSSTDPNFAGYSYTIGYSDVSMAYPGCKANGCVEAMVGVVWQSDVGSSLLFTRLFTR